MRTKKILALALVAVLLISAAPFASATNTPADSSGRIIISFINGFTGGDGGFMKKITDGFNANQDKYFVEEHQETDHYTKFKSGNYDLVLMAGDQLPTYVADGMLQPVASLYDAAGISIADFHPAAGPIVTLNNELYAFPLDIHPFTMLYNKALVEEPPTNLQELIDLNTKLQAQDPNIYAMAVPGAGLGDWYVLTLALQNGCNLAVDGQMVYNTDEFAESLLLLNDLIYKYKISPKNLGLDGEFNAFMKQADDNGTLQAAIAMTGPWFYSAAKEKYGDDLGLGQIPVIGKQPGVFGGAHTIAVPATVKEQEKFDGIVEFIKYLYTPENLLNWAESGQAPVHLATMEQVWANPDKYPLAAANSKQFDNVTLFPLYAFVEQGQYLRESVYSLVVTTEGLTKEQLMPELDKATDFARQILED